MVINQELIFAAGLFATVVVLAFALSGLVFRKDRVSARLRRTLPLEQDVIELEPVDSVGGPRGAATPVMERIGHAAARPFMPKTAAKQSKFRRQLMNAGIYSSQAMELFVGAKVILLAVGGLLGYLIGSMFPGYIVYVTIYGLCVLGFFLPDFWLRAKIASRRRALDAALPDALDLMLVCVESGLTLDASLKRVGEEIALAHPDISRELGITHMETRVGLSRIEALRNLGQRTGCASLQSLAAMLVQTERFGTSIAQALRVHAESLRIKRQHAAEEQAAKTSVKLAFPVVLFIFPTLLVVLGGPAIILLIKSPLFHRG
jgi:tight adherence protein C